ncbi:DUF397 domain-containing protein [Streptomyces sp. NPDC127108]|uniref:DUF397 domain-containing protein n=1 Tax=Streptomyces sp. NPDC127108 TaxID=3345361 RepID=UPI0036329F7E
MSADLQWFRSTYSSEQGGECVEVARAIATIHIRDSKNPTGPILHLHPATWTAFLTAHSPLGTRT